MKKNVKVPLLLTFGVCAVAAIALPAAANATETATKSVNYEFAFAVDPQVVTDPATDAATQQRLARETAIYCERVAVPEDGITTAYCQKVLTRAVNVELSTKRTEDQLALAN